MSADFVVRKNYYTDTFILAPLSGPGQLWLEDYVPLEQRTEGVLILMPDEVLPLIQSLTAEGYTVQQ